VFIKIFHALLSVPLRPLYRQILPATIFTTVELSIWGWEFRDKAAIHERLGPAFIIVTTGLNQLICADSTMAHAILSRRKDFVHPKTTTQAMSFLGKNILTVSLYAPHDQCKILTSSLEERRRIVVTPTSHHRPRLERTYKFRSLERECRTS
jgi:hypothetical protein